MSWILCIISFLYKLANIACQENCFQSYSYQQCNTQQQQQQQHNTHTDNNTVHITTLVHVTEN